MRAPKDGAIAANDAAGEALAVQDDLAVKLLETQPTTIAGAAALLTYYVDAVTTTQPEIVFPELDRREEGFRVFCCPQRRCGTQQYGCCG